MKPLVSIYLAVILCLFNLSINAQTCEVLLKSIAGTYTGDCSKGKANGTGTSIGEDKYSGEFKAGLPDGKGTYEWKNGDTFEGIWVKGMKEGKGTMVYKKPGDADSTVSGIWKKNVYAGNYETPYSVLTKGMYVSRIDVKKNRNSVDNTITITMVTATAGVGTVSGRGVVPAGVATAGRVVTVPAGTGPPISSSTVVMAPVLTDIIVTKGNYAQVVDGAPGSRSSSKKLLQVSYPFRAIYRVNGESTEIEISEPGEWTIGIYFNN